MTTPSFAAPAGNDPLAGLRDIHLPPSVSFWPPAPGWWVLAGLVVLLLVVLVMLELRRRQTLGYRAMQELNTIAQDQARYVDARAVAAASAVLMRRILLSRAGRTEAASLTGEGWLGFLAEGKGGIAPEVSGFIAAAPYLPPGAPGGDAVSREVVVAAVRRWIRGNA